MENLQNWRVYTLDVGHLQSVKRRAVSLSKMFNLPFSLACILRATWNAVCKYLIQIWESQLTQQYYISFFFGEDLRSEPKSKVAPLIFYLLPNFCGYTFSGLRVWNRKEIKSILIVKYLLVHFWICNGDCEEHSRSLSWCLFQNISLSGNGVCRLKPPNKCICPRYSYLTTSFYQRIRKWYLNITNNFPEWANPESYKLWVCVEDQLQRSRTIRWIRVNAILIIKYHNSTRILIIFILIRCQRVAS